MGSYPREIPVTELRPGLTIWRDDGNRYIRDAYLRDYFIGDYSPRDWMRRIQFTTAGGSILTWHPCGTIFVTNGHDDRKVIKKKTYYPEGSVGLQIALVYRAILNRKVNGDDTEARFERDTEDL